MQAISRVFACFCLSLLVTAAIAERSFGALSNGDSVQVFYGTGGTYLPPGGAAGTDEVYSGSFQIQQLGALDGSALMSFSTFCLEMNQALLPVPWPGDGIYTVASITPTIDNGDPVSNETKFLFGSFSNGSLGVALNGAFTYNDGNSANDLQQAIWYFQTVNGLSLTNISAGAQSIVSAVLALENGDPGAFATDSVNALNLYSMTSNVDQTQALLVILPANAAPPPPTLPEPTALSIWGGLCVAGLVAVGRRRRAV